MALGLPALIGMALASGGIGLAAGNAQRSLKEDADARHFVMQTLQQAIMNKAFAGDLDTSGLEAIGKQAFGKQWTPAMTEMIGTITGAARAARERREAFMQQALQDDDAGGGQPTPGVPGTSMMPARPLALPGAPSAAGEWREAIPGQTPPPGFREIETRPVPMPEPPVPIGTFGGRPIVPAEMPEPSMAPSEQGPFPGVRPVEMPEPKGTTKIWVRDPVTGASTPTRITPLPRGTRSVTVSETGVSITRGGVTDEQRRAADIRETIAQGVRANKAYGDIVADLATQGHAPPAELKQYGQTQYERARTQIFSDLLKSQKRTPTPQEQSLASFQAWQRTGYIPDADRGLIVQSQQDADNQFLKAVQSQWPRARGRVPFDIIMGNIMEVMPGGAQPSPAAIQQAQEWARGDIRATLQSQGVDPLTPAGEARVQGMMGFAGTTEAQIGRMNEPAAETDVQRKQRAIEELPKPLERNLPAARGAAGVGVPGVKAPVDTSPAAVQKRGVEREAAEAREAEAAKPVPPAAQGRVFDRTTGAPVQPKNQGDLDVGLQEGRYYKSPNEGRDVKGLVQLESYVYRYRDAMDVIKPYQERGLAGPLAALVVGIEFWGKKRAGGVLPDWVTKKVMSVLGVPEAEAKRVTRALVEINTLKNDAPLALRNMGQMGNTPGAITQLEASTFPDNFSNSLRSEAQYNSFVKMLTDRRRGIGMNDVPYTKADLDASAKALGISSADAIARAQQDADFNLELRNRAFAEAVRRLHGGR